MANEVKIKVSAQDDASQKLDNVADKVERLGGGTIKNALGNATAASTAFAAGLAAVGTGLGFVGGAMLKQAGNFEQTKIGFTTMLGSAEAAENKLRELSDFAVRTPFTLPGVETAAKKLLAMGFSADELLPTLKDVGDVASGLGLRQDGFDRLILNLGQVRTQGKLTGRDLRDFAINGVPLVEVLSKQLGVAKSAIADMVSEGQISDAMVTAAFRSMASEGGKFANLMEKQAQSMLGMWSNVQDTFIRFMRDAGMPLLENFAKPFLSWLLEAIQILPVLADKVVKFAEGFEHWGLVISIVAGVIVGGLIPAFVALAGVVLPVIASMVLAIAPFLLAGAALGALAYFLYEAYQTNFLGIRDAVVSVLEFVTLVITSFVDLFRLIWTENMMGIRDGTIALWEDIKFTFESAFNVLAGIVRTFTAILTGDWDAASLAITFTAENLLNVVVTIFRNIFTLLLNILKLNFEAMLILVGQGMKFIGQIFQTVWTNIGVFVGEIWTNMLQFIRDNIPIVGDLIANSAEFIASAFGKMFGGVGNVVSGVFNKIIEIIANSINWVIEKINVVLSWLKKLPEWLGGGIDLGQLSPISGKTIVAPENSVKDVPAPELPKLPEFNIPSFGGGDGSGGSGKSEQEKQIEQNIKDLSSDRQTAASNRESLKKDLEKIDEELAREQREGVSLNQQLLDKKKSIESQISSLDRNISRMDERLRSSQEELAIEERKRLAEQDEKDRLQQESRSISDIIAEQKRTEAEAEKAAKEREKEAKKSSTSTSSSTPSTVSTPSTPLSTAAQIQKNALEAGAVVILDQGSGGETHYHIDIHDNHFYGDEEGFAEKIGNSIVERLSIHTSFPSN